MRRHNLSQLGVQQLALRPCPMPEMLPVEQRGAVGKHGPEPRMQGGPRASRRMLRGTPGALRQQAKNQPCLGHNGASDQWEARGFGGARRRAEVTKGGQNG